MKYITFYRESNNFDDILNDIVLKKKLKFKIRWLNHLYIGINEYKDNSIISYINIKYGENITTTLSKDYTPIPNIDYIPNRGK